MSARRAFALIAVLWLTTGAAVLGLVIAMLGRDAIGTSFNRQGATRAEWRAEDCLSRARTLLAQALRDGSEASVRMRATALAALLRSSPLLRDCPAGVDFHPAGLQLDVNAADADALGRLFRRQGLAGVGVDSLVDAILDWRDADDVPRPHGAERAWYVRERRASPRDAPFAAVEELRLVRGLDQWDEMMGSVSQRAALASLLTVEPGRILVSDAPAAVLASLPGLTDETILVIERLRAPGTEPLRELLDLSRLISPIARDSLERHYPELARAATLDPEGWLLRIRAHGGESLSQPVAPWVELRVRLERGDGRMIVRSRYSIP